MEFAFEYEQVEFAGSIRALLERHWDEGALRRRWEGDRGGEAALWTELVSLGATASTVPVELGGLGLSALDIALLLEEMGRAAASVPLAETAFVAAPVLAGIDNDQARGTLAEIGDGAAVAISHPAEPLPPHADQAQILLLASYSELHAVRADEVTIAPVSSLDHARPVFRVNRNEDGGVLVANGSIAERAIAEIRLRSCVASAALLVGLCERMIEMAVAYSGERRQFGRPIGSFQAVKHMLANGLLALHFSRPVVYSAAASLVDSDSKTRAIDASHAKARTSDAAMRISDIALQVHGAIGYTWECDLHMWLKRAKSLSLAWGTSDEHVGEIAAALLGPDGTLGCWE